VSDPKPVTPPAAPATDSAVVKLLQQNARTHIDSVLSANGVKSAFRNLIANEIVAKVAALDLADLNPSAVIKRAKEFILANGLTAEEVLAPKTPAATPKKPAAAATGRAKAAPASAATPTAEGAAAAAAPKTRDEWQANRSTRISQILGSIAEE
jgi:hypothetical protein